MENLENSENFFKSRESRGNHDCAILSESITNSNSTFKCTQNAHICIEVIKIVLGGVTPTPFTGGWTPLQTPPLSPLHGSTSALRAWAQSLQYLVRPFPTLLENQRNVREFHLVRRVVTGSPFTFVSAKDHINETPQITKCITKPEANKKLALNEIFVNNAHVTDK